MTFYQKYRPANFDNLVGQEFVNQTLKKAIATNRIVGAYLLCGPRGTGKTSTARLIAKTINCLKSENGNPCLDCEICLDFAENKLVDIIEIDAASHTGVDNIREIIEKAQFSPTKTKYKVYIIDEVHMLSKGAFNALLKILEEPPKHVKFILATTETHKVPETIISRCQRYDFKRINSNDIIKRLQFVAKNEGIKVDEKSYKYIAENSNGGLRDALSLFEQMVKDKEIKYEDIIEKLGLIGKEEIKIFLNKLLKNDNSVLDDFDNLHNNGKNIKLFFKELIFFVRDETINKLKKGEDISKYLKITEILDETYAKTKYSLDEYTSFIIGILKILNLDTNNFINKNSSDSSQLSPNPTINSLPTSPNPLQIGEVRTKNETQDKEEKSNFFSPGLVGGQEGVENLEKNKKVEEKEEISEQDIFDTFSDIVQEKKPSIPKSSFDSNYFIAQLKSKGAKGAVTMSLRSSEIALNGDSLNIKPKTSIGKKSLENAEAKIFMKDILDEMGYDELKINIL